LLAPAAWLFLQLKEARMDVHCSKCGEPWDVYHLRHDAIFDIAINQEEAEGWSKLNARGRLSAVYRERFKAAGWQFGESMLDVLRCPACPKDAKPDQEKVAIKSAITEALGDDEDGIASAMEDFGL
jgi:hypothetical protein